MGIIRQREWFGPFVCVGECVECEQEIMYAVTSFRATWVMEHRRIRRQIEPVCEWLQTCWCMVGDND